MSLLDVLCALNSNCVGAEDSLDVFENNEFYNSIELVEQIFSNSSSSDDIITEEDDEDLDEEEE